MTTYRPRRFRRFGWDETAPYVCAHPKTSEPQQRRWRLPIGLRQVFWPNEVLGAAEIELIPAEVAEIEDRLVPEAA